MIDGRPVECIGNSGSHFISYQSSPFIVYTVVYTTVLPVSFSIEFHIYILHRFYENKYHLNIENII